MKVKKILVVDDEELLREIMKEVFEGSGHQVFTADSGQAAIAVLKNQSVDIVFSDVRMPNGDGLFLLDEINKMTHEKPKVVLLSGFTDISNEQAVKRGAVKLVQKPFAHDELLNLLSVCF